MSYQEHTQSTKTSNIHQSLRVAEECGIAQQFACNSRNRYLTGQLDEIDEQLDYYNNYQATNFNSDWFKRWRIAAIIGQRKKVYAELEQIKRITMPKKNEITDEMIQRARDYPITNLIDFSQKKARAWCHEDKNPSLAYWKEKNLAKCWVCDNTFDTIAVLMDRDGMKFRDAVLNLCNF